MKVMHILNTGGVSGAENVAISIINKMKKDYDIESYYVALEGDIRDILYDNKIPYIALPKLSPKILKDVIKNVSPDIIHAHDYTASINAALSMDDIPIISHIHNNKPWIKKINVNSIAYGISTLRYKKIVTVSDSIKNEYIFGRLIKSRTICLGNPMDMSNIRRKASEYECKNCFDLVYVGRLTEAKNPELLLNIVKSLINRSPDVRVAIVGEGDQYVDFKEKISELPKNAVKMYGFIQNPYPIMAKSKVLCLPSKWEGFGLAAAEALALGIPVVCSGAGGLKNIVNDECGAICGEESKKYIIEIEHLLTDPEYYHKKKEAALRRSLEIENMEKYSRELYEIYNSILNK